jgi:hypothetical protein
MIARRILTAVMLSSMAVAEPIQAHDFWASRTNRVMIAHALNRWADYCSTVFHFDRATKLADEQLEPKINSHLLLSPDPSAEVERWSGWLPYADPQSDFAKSTFERGSDALLAARADPSSAEAAEKLYTETMKGYFSSVYAKCREGASDEWIAQILYSGKGDLERFLATLEVDFAKSVRDVDGSHPKRVISRGKRKR